MSKPATRRQREWRRRQACGIRLLTVPVAEYPLANAAIEAGLLSVAEAINPAALARAASDVLAEWSRRWSENSIASGDFAPTRARNTVTHLHRDDLPPG